MPSHQFVIADVFSSTPFGGNQLAVFTDARGLSTRAMQALAREINFAESTFVLPPEDPRHAIRLRIFTPMAEVPFAGHPNVGSAVVLASLDRIAAGVERAEVVFGEGVGPVGIQVERRRDGTYARLIREAPVERPASPPDPAAAAAALSLPREAIRSAWSASVGLDFAFIQVADRATVDRAALNFDAWSEHWANGWTSKLFFFAGDTAPGSRIYARMFAPAFGVWEDAATGSAAAAFAGSLAEEQRAPGKFEWTIDQGVAMGRPSLLEAAATRHPDGRVTVTVGGYAVVVGNGTLSVPDGY